MHLSISRAHARNYEETGLRKEATAGNGAAWVR